MLPVTRLTLQVSGKSTSSRFSKLTLGCRQKSFCSPIIWLCFFQRNMSLIYYHYQRLFSVRKGGKKKSFINHKFSNTMPKANCKRIGNSNEICIQLLVLPMPSFLKVSVYCGSQEINSAIFHLCNNSYCFSEYSPITKFPSFNFCFLLIASPL